MGGERGRGNGTRVVRGARLTATMHGSSGWGTHTWQQRSGRACMVAAGMKASNSMAVHVSVGEKATVSELR